MKAHSEEIYDKSTQILRNCPKTWTYSSSRSSKVIDLNANRKRICNILLVIKSNFVVCTYLLPFSRYWHISLQNSLFFPSHPCLTPSSGGIPCDINVVYIPPESTFNGLQFCRRHYGHLNSFGHCCLPKSQNHAKFQQNLTLQQFKVIQGHRSWC